MSEGESMIVLRRVRSKQKDVFRDYKIELDGKVVASIANDTTVHVPATPGAHKLRVTIDWCSSPTIDVNLAANETQRFECGPASLFLVLLHVTFMRDRYLWLRSAR